jgi:hypothetical protein
MGYTTVNGFEDGTLGHFDVETDTNSALDFPHYTELARTPGLAMPYRGAYCMRIALGTASTAGAWVQETGSWDMTAGTEDIYIRLKFWLSKDAAMSNNDVFNLIDLRSGADTTPHTDGTAEAVVSVQYTTASGWRLGIGETAPTSLVPLTLGVWHDVEVYADVAGGAAGTIDCWLDRVALTQVGSLTQANITSGAVGAVPGAAFTPTAGTLLIDEVIASQTDDTSARIGVGGPRFPETLMVQGSGHAFVGHGILDNAALLANAETDNVLNLYDTDRADTTNTAPKLVLKNLTANESPVDPAGMPVQFTKGCYVEMTGTDAENIRALLTIRRAVGYGSDGAIRNLAYR